MTSILCTVSSEQSTYGFRCLLPSFIGIGRTDQLSPSFNSVRSNQLHSNSIIRCHKRLERRVERFSYMLSIKKFSIWILHSDHLYIGDAEVLFYNGYYFSDVEIHIRLEHSISFIRDNLISQKLLPRELIPKINNFKLPWVTNKNISNIKILKTDIRIMNLLEEHFLIFNIVLT